MARVEVAPDLIEIFEHAADALKLETYDSKLNDFKVGDIVHCSLLHGIYKVADLSTRVWIIDINDLDESSILPIKPKYLKKLDKDAKALKVLFSKDDE